MIYGVKEAFLAIIISAPQFSIFGTYTTSFSSNSLDSDDISISSIEDALVYPKHAISHHHEGEYASNALVKSGPRKPTKIRLKRGREKVNQAWYEFNNQKRKKVEKKSNHDLDGKSTGSSFPGNTLQRKNAKMAKALKQMEKFTKTFQKPKDILMSQKTENIYARHYPQYTNNQDSQKSTRRSRTRQMASERQLHLSKSGKQISRKKD